MRSEIVKSILRATPAYVGQQVSAYSQTVVALHVWRMLAGLMCGRRVVSIDLWLSLPGYHAPKNKVYLPYQFVHECNTSKTIAILAHELGHALQRPLLMVQIYLRAAAFLSLGYWFWFPRESTVSLVVIHLLAVLLYSWVSTVFFEWDASRRALNFLRRTRIVNMKIASLVTWRAFRTYLFL